jgi:gluconolactonase
VVACEGGARRVTRIDPDGSVTVLANRYDGRRLNRPNDVVVKSDGSVYFTDPGGGRVESELDFCGVYRVSPDRGSIHLRRG